MITYRIFIHTGSARERREGHAFSESLSFPRESKKSTAQAWAVFETELKRHVPDHIAHARLELHHSKWGTITLASYLGFTTERTTLPGQAIRGYWECADEKTGARVGERIEAR